MRIQKEMLKRERENLIAGIWDREKAMGPVAARRVANTAEKKLL